MDWKLRSGGFKERVPLPMPCILGADIAGVVEAVGEGGADFSVGDPVYSMVGLVGAYAEFDQRITEWLKSLRSREASGIHTPHEFVALDHILHDMRL